MSYAARQFLAALAREEEHFLAALKLDVGGLGMLTAIKEFDFYLWNYHRHERTDDTEQHVLMLRLGLPKLIAGILGQIPRFTYPTVTFRSPEILVLGALDQVMALGFIEQGRRLAHAALAGECKMRQVDDRTFEAVLPNPTFNMEQHEASVEQHYNRFFREQRNEKVDRILEANGTGKLIAELLRENVYVFRDHFIGYDADPLLDMYFFTEAGAELAEQAGYDTFAAHVQFGGITMQKYVLALQFLLSLALKHEAFAETLVTEHPEIRLRDVLTITNDRGQFEAGLVEALNMFGPRFDGYSTLTREEARTILRVLSIRRDNLGILSHSMAPLPFLIEYSDVSWVTSVAAIRIGAAEFLLNSLRHNFPADYDRNQQLRESSMQRALRQELDSHLPGLTLVDNIAIRRDGRVLTDIDFAAVDSEDGTVVLFQLKHQDPYGGDMRRRSNRAGRLLKETSSWLEATREWIATSDALTIRSALRLKKDVACRRFYLVVIARHFAHFLSSADLQDDATYCTFIQFYDGIMRMHAEGGPVTLRQLVDTLQRFMTHKVVRPSELFERDSYHLRNVSYSIRPDSMPPADQDRGAL